MNKLKFLERSIESKIDIEVYDNEIAELRAMIGNLEDDDKSKKKFASQAPKTSGSALNPKDLEAIRNILERFPQLEDTQQRVLRDIKSLNIQSIRDSIETINK